MQEEGRLEHAVTSTANALRKEVAGTGGEVGTRGTVDPAYLETLLALWPDTPQKMAKAVIDRYALPNEATPSLLIWYGNGPWKRTIVYRDEVPHNFPKPHTDLLEQFIDYRVPPAKCDDLAAFDGSVIPERTKGQISARCDMEEMNFLALNLAHDIVTGQRTVEEARELYAETVVAFRMDRPALYTERLLFPVPRGGTADLDATTIGGAMMHQMAEKVEDVVSGATETGPS